MTVLTTGQLLKKHQIKACKKLGQNFLLDQNVTAKIVSFSDDVSKHNIVEIGPGPGSLTQHIIPIANKKIILIEPDERFFPILYYLADTYEKSKRVDIINSDALKIDLDQKFEGEKYVIISNLPYNVSTMLLFYWTENMRNFTEMILMFQKEVAMRIAAVPQTKQYGRISIMMQYMFDISTCYQLAPHYFSPAPKVCSTVLKFIPKLSVDYNLYNNLNKLTKLAFANRRKFLLSNLKNHYYNIQDLFQEYDIKQNIRAEELSVDIFVQLASRLV